MLGREIEGGSRDSPGSKVAVERKRWKQSLEDGEAGVDRRRDARTSSRHSRIQVMSRNSSFDSLSSSEAEIETWARPSAEELEQQSSRKAFLRLPKELRAQIRAEHTQFYRDKATRMREPRAESAAKSPPSADPLADIAPVFPAADCGLPSAAFAERDVAAAIRNPFNRAVYDLAVGVFPFFRTNCNLLLTREQALTMRDGQELRIFVHECADRTLYGVGISGPLGRVKHLRVFTVAV